MVFCLAPALVAGCVSLGEKAGPVPVAPGPAEAQRAPPLVTDRFELGPQNGDVIGAMQVVLARRQDTLLDIARAYDLGYDEIVSANPGLNPWLPGEGTPIVLPTQYVLPHGPREGIVLNIATRRLFYFPEPEPGTRPVVVTHPMGIGRVGWNTPVGVTTVTAKARDPVWWVPISVREEHAEMGDPLPAQVPPGPDNPLGHRVLGLGLPGYLIHGTNRPDGVGMRVSHGCIRLYPEDIERLYAITPIGTPVRIINDPHPFGWRNGQLYLDAHRPLEDDLLDHRQRVDALLQALRDAAARQRAAVDPEHVAGLLEQGRGYPVPVTRGPVDPATVLARALPVANTVEHESVAAPPEIDALAAD
ncbi:hypothetical protein BH24PSE2_BH24PSE2_02060 [soil metagenome]